MIKVPETCQEGGVKIIFALVRDRDLVRKFIFSVTSFIGHLH